MSGAVYLNGRYVDAAEARVSVFDSAFLYGLAVFETLALEEDGGPLGLEEHLARLWEGCRRIRIAPRLKHADVGAIFRELARRGGPGRYRGRITISRGADASLGLASEPTEVVALLPMPPWPSQYRVKTIETERGPLRVYPVIKSANRIEGILATEEAQAEGYDDALFVDAHGHVLEGPTWNVFIARAGWIETPPLSLGVLPGTVRGVLLAHLGEWGYGGGEAAFGREELLAADEAFLSSSTRGVLPIVAVDDRPVGSGRPGPIAADLGRRYWTVVRKSK
ncbi:aminotransferase class IV [bacterium]|nr:aminotransferase class IV [bacterium]